MFDLPTEFYIAGCIGAGIAILFIWLWSLSYREQRAVQRETQRRDVIAVAIRNRDTFWGETVQRTFFPTKQDVRATKEAIDASYIEPASVTLATKNISLVFLNSGAVIYVTGHETPLAKKIENI
jgi:hypothetical protein